MEQFYLSNFTGGWFVGDFDPAIIKSKHVEVAIKRYGKWHREPSHVHKIADEITVIIEGTVLMKGHIYGQGQAVLVKAGEATDFFTLTDVVTCVIKSPSVIGDKYQVSEP